MKLVKLILQKAGDYLELIKNLKGQQGPVVFHINKSLAKVVHSLSHLQSVFPLLFTIILSDYMSLTQIIIQNNDWFSHDSVVKAALLALNKILNTFTYYADPIQFQQSPLAPSPLKNFATEQQLCNEQYTNYFTESVIENYFNSFVLRILPIGKEKIYKEISSNDTLVESGNLITFFIF